MTQKHKILPNNWLADDRYRLLVEAVDSVRDYAIFVLDATGHVLTWNAGAERIKGYSREEIVGKHFSIFYTPADHKRRHPEEELEIATRVGKFEEEGWRVRKDGRLFWASVLITRLTDADGKLVGFSKVTRDLTERRKAEEALRISEERFRGLVEGVKEYAIFGLDPAGIVTSWNEGAQRLKGYAAGEIIGQHFSKFYPEEEVTAGKCEFELEEAALTGRYEEEGWRLRKDGTRFWANVVITAIRDSHGRLVGYSKVTRDLTDRRRAEERMRRNNESLEKRVAERTAELTKAKHDLERALAARDEFLSIASHELKTPITSLKLQTEMLSYRLNPDAGKTLPADKLVKSMATILRQTERLNSLVDYMLDVSRVQLGRFTFEFKPASLSELMEHMAAQWREPLLASGCELSVEIEKDVTGRFDSYRLEQVVANLFSNVIKYAPGKPVEFSLRAEGNFAVIRVADSGPGIDASLTGRAFDRFERVSAPVGTSGFGLGLFIAKTIVEAHYGEIFVESEVGAGAAFSVRIPLNISQVSGSADLSK